MSRASCHWKHERTPWCGSSYVEEDVWAHIQVEHQERRCGVEPRTHIGMDPLHPSDRACV